MKKCFVPTSNSLRFFASLNELERRGAAEACLMVVDGEPGLGKTTTIQWWATQQNAVFIRAKAEWTPQWMLKELLSVLGRQPEHSFERKYTQAIRTLSDMAVIDMLFAAGDATITEMDDSLTRDQKNIAHAGTAGGLVGGLAGAKTGAMAGAALGGTVGAFFGGVGAVPGAAIGGAVGGIAGGVAGWWGGSEMGEWLGSLLWESNDKKEDKPLQADFNLTTTVELDGQAVGQAVSREQALVAQRY